MKPFSQTSDNIIFETQRYLRKKGILFKKGTLCDIQ